MKRWVLGTGAICILFIPMIVFSGGWLTIAIYMVSSYFGWLCVTGIPFFMGAALLFSSNKSKRNFVDSDERGNQVHYYALFISYAILTMILMTFITIASLVFVIGMRTALAILFLLPIILAPTLLISLLLCTIASLIAIALDDWKRSTVIGFLIFVVISFVTGFPRVPSNYPEIAFINPVHIHAALQIVLISGFQSYYSFGFISPFTFTFVQLFISLIAFFILSGFCYWLAGRLFPINLQRWKLEMKTDDLDGQTLLEQDRKTLTRLQAEVGTRRRFTTTFLVLLIILIPILGVSYTTARDEEWTTVVYESPSGGENIVIGEWKYGSFRGMDSPMNIDLSLGCQGQIHSWSGGSGDVYLNFEYREMTIAEFQAMNETAREDMFGRGWSGSHGSTGSFSTGWQGPVRNENYLWVLRFFDVNGQTEGTILVTLRILIRAI